MGHAGISRGSKLFRKKEDQTSRPDQVKGYRRQEAVLWEDSPCQFALPGLNRMSSRGFFRLRHNRICLVSIYIFLNTIDIREPGRSIVGVSEEDYKFR